MRRTLAYLLICLPLCLFLVPDRSPVALSIPPSSTELICDDGATLPDDAEMVRLARSNPVELLELCLKRYHREVNGYCGLLKKQERIKGQEQRPELIDVWFREQPYSVMMKWRQGARNAKASLYVDGQNKNRAAVLTNLRLSFVTDIDPEGRLATDAGRYSIRESSLRQGTERTLRAWQAAKDNGSLVVDFKGKMPVDELGGRTCYVLKRSCSLPEDDGIASVEIAIDAENWIQTGSTLLDVNGQLVGKYLFTGLKINPDFDEMQFDRSTLKK